MRKSVFVFAGLAASIALVGCDVQKTAEGNVEVPKYEDTETTFGDLKERIAKTLAFIESLDRAAIEASAERDITTGSGDKARHFKGQSYLAHYALAHFFFHATTAYDILRHNGVEIGKKDFIGSF